MKKSKLLWIGVYIVIVAVILIGYQIYQYKVSNDLYTKLRTEVTIIEDADLKIDWSKLEKDVIGWIYFPKNNINYPIMQGETNKTYLNISYDKSNNVCGSIFLNSGNDAALTDVNSIIYGHNMADGSMFNDLKYYAEKEYWYNNPYFYVYLPDGTRHRYDIFVVQDVKDGTAANISTQIIAQVASCQYGGQSISLAHLARFVDVSRKKFQKQTSESFERIGIKVTEEQLRTYVEELVKEEVKKGIQMIQYQVITLMTTNGQAPFITINLYLNEAENEQHKKDLALCIEEMLCQRIQGVKNEKGVYITPAFPKLIYVLQEDNIKEGTPYYYLTELAAKCTAKRMVPDYVSEKIMLESKIDKNGEGHCYPPMGCRSFLTPYVDENGKPKYYGRFNQGVVTINLVDVAISSRKNIDQFWKIFDERLTLCHTALRARHERLLGTKVSASPIHWRYGALARLPLGETIDKLLYDGYSTLSLGYAGLYECCKYMTEFSHTDERAKDFALSVMQHMNDKCAEWKKAERIDYSLYGTPLESTTYKFAKCLKKRFGVIEGVTDRDYITNSYHVPVFEEIDAFTKLGFESEFQKLSPGGAISYVEVPNMQDNIPAVISIMQYIYDNIMYAELNTKSDYCQVCDYDGEIEIVEDSNGKLFWRCPNCGNTDEETLDVVRRTCGYLGKQFWNAGRTAEIKARVLHVS